MVAFPQKRLNLLYGTPCRMDAPGSTIQIWTEANRKQAKRKRAWHDGQALLTKNLEVRYLFTVTAAPE